MMLRTTSLFWLSAVLLADVAPYGSCRRSENNNDNITFVVSASDCSCLPATLEVVPSGATGHLIELRCGFTASISFYAELSGTVRVTQYQTSTLWLEAPYSARQRESVAIALQCPRR
jgi:hypothetical protein